MKKKDVLYAIDKILIMHGAVVDKKFVGLKFKYQYVHFVECVLKELGYMEEK